MKMTFFTKLILGLSLAATGAFAQSFCSTASHSGTNTKTNGTQNKDQYQTISSIGNYKYELWYRGGNGASSATFYSEGSMKCSAVSSDDYLCRMGLSFNSDKYYTELDHMYADFKVAISGQNNIGYSFIGIYGWSKDPMIEYYIVDNWASQYKPGGSGSGWNWTYKGSYTLDGDEYEAWTHRQINQWSLDGMADFDQFYSVRKTARSCGTIDITGHFEQWAKLGMKLGKLYEAKVLGEVGNGSGVASCELDFPVARVYTGSAPAPTSSSSTPTSSASPDFGNQTPYSSNSIPGTIEIENFDEGANGEAYNEVDGTDEPQGGSYRPDVNVDIIGVGSGYGVGYTGSSEWLEYTVDIPTGGTYNATIMIANGNANAAEVSLTIDGNSVGSISAPSTDDGKWQVFAEASTATPIRLPQGRHILRVSFPYCNADWLKFELVEADPDAIPFAKASVNQPVGKFQVFDMQGKLLGFIDMAHGSSMQNVLKQKFHKSGVYLVRQGDLMQKIAVR